MTLTRPAVTRTEIGGVPVFSVEAPGPMQCMLAFRVGVVDETLPTRGVTHLVEHLAMYPLMQSASSYGHERINARVEALRTRFFATGSPEEIRDFLQDLCWSLSGLALDRLENERKILRTEAANRTGGSLKACWTWRYGPTGLGLCDWEEFGLRWVKAERVERWAREWFTAQNAVLWLSGPVPQGLKLELPAGERKALPVQRPMPYVTPAMYQHGDRFALLQLVGPRTVQLMVASWVLNLRLRDRIRQRESLAYDVRADYLPLDKETAELTAFADSLQANSKAAADAIAEEARRLGADGPEPSELATVRAERLRALENPDSRFGFVDAVAIAELELRDSEPERIDAEIEALTPREIADTMRSAFPSALLSVPQDVPMTTPGFKPVPITSGRRFPGTLVVAMPGAGHSDVIDLSSDGISMTFPNQTLIGMSWQEIALALWWADGRRTLFNLEGAGIHFNPEKWRQAQTVLGAMQAHVPADKWVPMDEPDALPREERPVCSICRGAPAIEVRFRDPFSVGIWIVWGTVHGAWCRDCGIATFRTVQKRLLRRGWWSLPGLVATPISLVANSYVLAQFNTLPVPVRASGIDPLPQGRAVVKSPEMLILAAIVGVLALLMWHPWAS